MAMYDLMEYSNNYSETSRSLWQYYRNEAWQYYRNEAITTDASVITNFTASVITNFTANDNSNSFKLGNQTIMAQKMLK